MSSKSSNDNDNTGKSSNTTSTQTEDPSAIYMTHHHHQHTPSGSRSGSSTPHLSRTPSSPAEKSYDHIQRVKDEDKQGLEYDIHCTCCEGPHKHGHGHGHAHSLPIPVSRCAPRCAISFPYGCRLMLHRS